MRKDYGKAVLILSNLNKQFEQLKVDFIDNVNIEEVNQSMKDLHLNKKKQE